MLYLAGMNTAIEVAFAQLDLLPEYMRWWIHWTAPKRDSLGGWQWVRPWVATFSRYQEAVAKGEICSIHANASGCGIYQKRTGQAGGAAALAHDQILTNTRTGGSGNCVAMATQKIPPPTPAEFEAKMKAIFSKGYDPERAHGQADDLLIETLITLGYKKGAAIFTKAERWYH